MTRPPNHGPWGRRDPENSQGDDHPEWGLPGERKSGLGCLAFVPMIIGLWIAIIYEIGRAVGWW